MNILEVLYNRSVNPGNPAGFVEFLRIIFVKNFNQFDIF